MRSPYHLPLLLALLASCGGGTRKLDEAVFYDGPQFRLKLTRYYENIPLHYTGEVYRVHCASRETRHSPAHITQDSGWVSIGNGGAIGSKSAAELVGPLRGAYRVIDERTLVWTGNGFNVSFDACGQFRSWYPTRLPAELIDPVEKPEWCAPAGTADCRNYDFMGDRTPRFEEIEVRPDGQVAFVARSPAFRPNGALRVESADSGRSWTVRGSGAAGQRDSGTAGQRDSGTAGQRDSGTAGQRDDNKNLIPSGARDLLSDIPGRGQDPSLADARSG